MEIYYLVYKLTNSVNGKIYIGCHMTKNLDDGYMGSGKRLGYAKKKYGIENFKKDILSTHETPEQMLIEEARLVNEEFLGREDVYNLTCGGRGSWFYVNLVKTPEQRIRAGRIGGLTNCNQGYKNSQSCWINDTKKNKKIKRKDLIHYLNNGWIKGRKLNNSQMTIALTCLTNGNSIESLDKKKQTCLKIQHQTGEKNSQFGTCWIYNGIESKKIHKEDLNPNLNAGWFKGRKMKHGENYGHT